ncbi:hypothetical protein NPIL_547941 [Nephila pilipes]|uniref:Uncharacterized protein n=1 Tax=Nephila pilipes TaxID=299642 RepID=A0A8X6U6U2_NEPPI|nr:hypothetical protein NPIL_547941 [Nephila pilipes]
MHRASIISRPLIKNWGGIVSKRVLSLPLCGRGQQPLFKCLGIGQNHAEHPSHLFTSSPLPICIVDGWPAGHSNSTTRGESCWTTQKTSIARGWKLSSPFVRRGREGDVVIGHLQNEARRVLKTSRELTIKIGAHSREAR